MGVYIKGIKMPDHCGQCFAYDTTYRVCNLYFMGIPNRMTSLEHRPEWCELVELQSHGRLIDADALKELYDLGEELDYCYVKLPVIRLNIDDMPTILEAEEGEI